MLCPPIDHQSEQTTERRRHHRLTYEILQHLLTHNAKVYLAARSKDKAEVAIRELYKETGKTAIFLKLDLASLKSVKASAEEFLRYSILHPSIGAGHVDNFQFAVKNPSSMSYLTMGKVVFSTFFFLSFTNSSKEA